jgi:hypothetical protein
MTLRGEVEFTNNLKRSAEAMFAGSHQKDPVRLSMLDQNSAGFAAYMRDMGSPIENLEHSMVAFNVAEWVTRCVGSALEEAERDEDMTDEHVTSMVAWEALQSIRWAIIGKHFEK